MARQLVGDSSQQLGTVASFSARPTIWTAASHRVPEATCSAQLCLAAVPPPWRSLLQAATATSHMHRSSSDSITTRPTKRRRPGRWARKQLLEVVLFVARHLKKPIWIVEIIQAHAAGLSLVVRVSPPPPPPPPPPATTLARLQAKAHMLADIIVRQDGQVKELQRQLAAVHAVQAEALAAATAADAGTGVPSAPLGPAQLDAMRRTLAMAQVALQQQAAQLEGTKAEYGMRSALLQEAAGAARREVLALQGANGELQALADRLKLQNGQLAARLKEAVASCSDVACGAAEGGAASVPAATISSSSLTASAKRRHLDPALLQAMLRRTEG